MCARVCVCARLLLLAALAGSVGWGADGEVVVSVRSGGGGGGGGVGVGSAGPMFAPRQRTVSVAAVGQAATLDCRVLRLADKSVSWVRSDGLQILSHAGIVFTADSRVSATSEPSSGPASGGVSHHTLRIERLRVADAGRYECQVNTEPKMSLFFNLTVLDEPVPVVVVWPLESGAGAVGVDGVVRAGVGGAATLSCGARYEPPPRSLPLPPLDIRWTKDGHLINLQSPRGGVSLDTERWPERAESRLTLAALTPSDGGRYTCTAGDTHTHLRLFVTDTHSDEQLNAMQRDQSAERQSSSSCRHRLSTLAFTLTVAQLLVFTMAHLR